MHNIKCIILINILLLLLSFASKAQKIKFDKVSAKQFRAFILEDEDNLLIDVSSKNEFDNERIQGAICAETSQILYSILDTTPENQPVLIYCTSGKRSLKAYWLIKKNYPHEIFNLKGGLKNWITKGYKVKTH